MKRRFSLTLLVLLWNLGAVRSLAAQDLAITNARIIVGNGTVINQGSIVVRGGRIASVSAGPANVPGVQTIDARGATAMPGFIDGHRHVNTGPNEKEQMQQLLDAGYTTILSGGGPAEGNLTLKDHIEKGVIKGPRIVPSGRVDLANNTPATARGEVQRLPGAGTQVIRGAGAHPQAGTDCQRTGQSQGYGRRIKEGRRLGPDTRCESTGH